MTLLRPGMKATYRLPDGSIFEVMIGTEGVDDQLKESPSFDGMESRELDAAVAARVFGFTVEWRTNTRTRAKEALRLLENGNWVVVPFYSERMSASITLGLRLQDLGWKQTSAPRDLQVTLAHADGRSVTATGRSEHEALARAAVKAM